MSFTKSSGICLIIAAVLATVIQIAPRVGFDNRIFIGICASTLLLVLLLALLLAFIGLFRSSERSGKTFVFLIIAFGVLGKMGNQMNQAKKGKPQTPPAQTVKASEPKMEELSPQDKQIMNSAIDLAIGLEAVSVSYQKSWEKVRTLSKQLESPVRDKTSYHELAAASQQFETSSNSLADQIKKQPKMFRDRLQANGMPPAEIEKVMVDFMKGYTASSALSLEAHKHSKTVADSVQRLYKQLITHWEGWDVKDGRVAFTDAAQNEVYQKDLAQLQEIMKKKEAAEKRWMENMPK